MKLDQFLKFQGLVGTGGEAKLRIQRGDVRVNGAIETRRGRQLGLGDAVQIDGREIVVTPIPLIERVSGRSTGSPSDRSPGTGPLGGVFPSAH